MARAIAFLIILASALTGAQRSLNKIRQRTYLLFTDGAIVIGESIETDLAARVLYADSLADIAEKYINASDAFNLLVSAREELMKAGRPYEKYTANDRLTQAADIVITTLLEGELALTGNDIQKVEALDASLKGRNRTIASEAALYNEKAREYNARLDTFPGIITKVLKMTAALELYEEVIN